MMCRWCKVSALKALEGDAEAAAQVMELMAAVDEYHSGAGAGYG